MKKTERFIVDSIVKDTVTNHFLDIYGCKDMLNQLFNQNERLYWENEQLKEDLKDALQGYREINIKYSKLIRLCEEFHIDVEKRYDYTESREHYE